MNSHFHNKLALRASGITFLLALTGVYFAGPCSPSVLAAGAKEPGVLPENPGEPGGPRVSAVRSGVLDTRDGLTLRLNTDLGTVNIVPLEQGASPVVRYTVHIETDAHGAVAQQLLNNYSLRAIANASGVEIAGSLPSQSKRSGNVQFWVQYELAIPRNYSVDVSTEVGDITTGDIGGTATLRSQGGNIVAGHIGVSGLRGASRNHPMAKLETEGGQIQVLKVTGDLTAFTAGGHINVGDISGDASLHTGGGHIRAGSIGGRAELDTEGGNITVAQAGHLVNVRTGGGQIDFGEVRGSVRAQTGGGGIRVMYVSGPMEVESNAGSICLTHVADAVQASTSGGTITAWINPQVTGNGPVRLAGPSQLATGSGDIIVFLPKNLAATIDATVANGKEHQIEADSGLHLVFQTVIGNGPLHALATPNGGGALLKLRTTGGKIRLQYLDSMVAIRENEKLFNEQKDRLNERMKGIGISQISFSKEAAPPPAVASTPPPSPNNIDWLDSWLYSLEEKFRGGISENPDDFLNRFTYRSEPSYPALAQKAGIQGDVKLQVKIRKDGQVEVQKVLEGEPALVDAAIDSVKRWRAQPPWLNGKPVDVISTVTFRFLLR